jgi:hypothetical protein
MKQIDIRDDKLMPFMHQLVLHCCSESDREVFLCKWNGGIFYVELGCDAGSAKGTNNEAAVSACLKLFNRYLII